MVGAGHHGAPAGLLDAGDDRLGIGRDHNRPGLGRLRAPQDVHDHRRAGDVGERLARQPGRGHPGGNDDEDVVSAMGCEIGRPINVSHG